jgi:transposase-like protein
MDLKVRIVESVKKRVPKSETARRFGVHRATVKRYCKQLDERGTLEPRKPPGKAPKPDEKAPFGQLRREVVGHPLSEGPVSLRRPGARVSEATVCRSVRRIYRSQKTRTAKPA